MVILKRESKTLMKKHLMIWKTWKSLERMKWKKDNQNNPSKSTQLVIKKNKVTMKVKSPPQNMMVILKLI